MGFVDWKFGLRLVTTWPCPLPCDDDFSVGPVEFEFANLLNFMCSAKPLCKFAAIAEPLLFSLEEAWRLEGAP